MKTLYLMSISILGILFLLISKKMSLLEVRGDREPSLQSSVREYNNNHSRFPATCPGTITGVLCRRFWKFADNLSNLLLYISCNFVRFKQLLPHYDMANITLAFLIGARVIIIQLVIIERLLFSIVLFLLYCMHVVQSRFIFLCVLLYMFFFQQHAPQMLF